jgi:hypothetical protein
MAIEVTSARLENDELPELTFMPPLPLFHERSPDPLGKIRLTHKSTPFDARPAKTMDPEDSEAPIGFRILVEFSGDANADPLVPYP